MEKEKHLSLNKKRLYVVTDPVNSPYATKIMEDMLKAGIPEEAFVFNEDFNDPSLALGQALSRLKKEQVTVVFDNSSVTKKAKHQYLNIAKEANADSCFIDVDSNKEEAKEYALRGEHGQMYQTIINSWRTHKNEIILEADYDRIIYKGEHSISFEDIETQYKLDKLESPEINKNSGILTDFNGYVIGDIHGMHNDLIKTMEDLGFETKNNHAEHPRGKKMLFLGDLVDRGKQSVDVLEFVMNTVENGDGYLILGNHEIMLLDGLHKILKEDGQAIPDSLASGDTLASVIRHPDPEFPERVYDFLNKTPTSIRLSIKDNEIECIHAPGKNIEGISKKRDRTHGKNIGTYDGSSFAEINNPSNKFTLCGHETQPIESMKISGKQYNLPLNCSNVLSLDLDGCSTSRNKQGYLGVVDIERAILLMELKGHSLARAINNSFLKYETEPNMYRFEVNRRKELVKELGDCVDDQEVGVLQSSDNYYTYLPNKEIYSQGRMYEKPIFKDIAGGIGVDSGMKILFIGEPKSDIIGDDTPILEDDTQVLEVENVRGFNVNVARNEYGTGLIVTTASRENNSRYEQMAIDMLKEKGIYDKLNNFLGKDENNMTLSLKIRHPDDKRSKIAKDSNEEYGVTLMSARRNNAYSPITTEKHLNFMGEKMGISRPKTKTLSFKDAFNYKKDIEDVKNGKDIRTLDGRPKLIRKSKNPNNSSHGDYQILPTAQSVMKKVFNDLTPKKIDEIIDSRGAVMRQDNFFYQTAMTHIINQAHRKGRLDELKDVLDLQKSRERKDLTPQQKKSHSYNVNNLKTKLVYDSVERSFNTIIRSEYKCDPVKYEKIQSNNAKIEEQKNKEIMMRERKKQLLQRNKKEIKKSYKSYSP